MNRADTAPASGHDAQPTGPRRSLRGTMLAALATAVAAVVAIGIWTLGQAQYLNDYCTTRVQPPQGATPESVGGRPAFLEGLTTVRCEYDGQPTVTVTDPLPLLGAVVLVLGVVAVAVIAFRSARRATN